LENRFPADSRPFVALPFIPNTSSLRAVTKHSPISPYYDDQSPASGENQGTEAKPWPGLFLARRADEKRNMTIPGDPADPIYWQKRDM
jgi:hypothetical protein